jgi:hypothetical protein
MDNLHPRVALEYASEMPHEVRIHLDENATGIAMHLSHERRADIANTRPVLDDHPRAVEIYSPQKTFGEKPGTRDDRSQGGRMLQKVP